MKKYLNEDLIKIIISIILIIISFLFKNNLRLILLLLSYIIISYEMYIESFKDIIKGEIFNENFLMIIATIGAFYIGSTLESVLVILLFQIGEYLSDLAVNKSKESITSLMSLKIKEISIVLNNEVKSISPEKVAINDIIIIKNGEMIPVDGVIIEGNTHLDTSSLTGESKLLKAKEGDKVLSGFINKDNVIKIKATTNYKNSTTQRIIEMIEKSEDKKSNYESFIRKFSKVYTPIIVVLAVLITLIPTILGYNIHEWLYRSLIFIVTSCPCALVISVPLGYFCGIGRTSKEGVVVKGAKELENLKEIDYLILDKTGTITEGVFEVTKIDTKMKKEEFLKLVASAEVHSNHPIAKAIKDKYNDELLDVTNYKEIPGKGIRCKINNKDILVGNNKLLEENNIIFTPSPDIGTIIYLAEGKNYKGYLVISDKIKESSKNIKNLNEIINKEIIVLSGDNNNIVKDVCNKIGIKKYFGELLPLDKVAKVEDFKKDGKVLFVGDGINDAPVIKMSDVGVSVGGIGSDVTIEASDVVLMSEDITKIGQAIKISKLTSRKVTTAIIFALVIKFSVLLMAILGISTILLAVFADVGVTLLAILYVLTIFYTKI